MSVFWGFVGRDSVGKPKHREVGFFFFKRTLKDLSLAALVSDNIQTGWNKERTHNREDSQMEWRK